MRLSGLIRFFAVAVSTAILSSASLAQPLLATPGKSGIAVSGGFTADRDLTAFGGTVAGTWRGIVDVEMSVGRSRIEGRRELPGTIGITYASITPTERPDLHRGERIDATTYSPSVAVHLRSVADVSFAAGYEWTRYPDAYQRFSVRLDGAWIGPYSVSRAGTGYSFGATLSRTVRHRSRLAVSLYGGGDVRYGYIRERYIQTGVWPAVAIFPLPPRTMEDTYAEVRTGIVFHIPMPGGEMGLTPEYRYGASRHAVGVSLGYAFVR